MPSFTYRQVIKKIKKCGFYLKRQGKGSHPLWINDEGVHVLISNHPGNIPTGTITKIAKQAGFKNLQEFEQF